jgi:cell division protein FtsA
MNMVKKRWLIAGIDVGTTKVCSVIAEADNGHLKVLGAGWSNARGLKKGVVINLSETTRSVKDSLEKAEAEAQSVVESSYVSVGGGYLRSQNTSGHTDVRGKNGQVTAEDIGRAVAEAQSYELPEDYQILHALTQNFSLDGKDGVLNPLGMSARHLAVNLHLVLNASAVVQNVVNVINNSGVVVDGVVMQHLASAEAVLTSDEKELGALLIDIGGGTTDIALFLGGSIWHSAVLPVGGSLITKDIAIGLKAPLNEAEELKREMGTVFSTVIAKEELIEIGEMGTGRYRTIPRRLLCQIIEARCDEILDEIARIVSKSRIRPELLTGAVFTGGGALLHGLLDRAEQVLGMPVRLGHPINVESANEDVFHPAFSTALGILSYASKMRDEELAKLAKPAFISGPKARTERLKHWIFERIG